MNNVASFPEEPNRAMTEEDHFQLSQVFQSLQGVAELILYSGDERFLPEMKTEHMAAILSSAAAQGEEILARARPAQDRAKPTG